MSTSIADAMTRKQERQAAHFRNVTYVVLFHERLRRIRGQRSQLLLACMADVAQSYISRVEAGITNGIGPAALQRVLDTYKEIEEC